LAVSSAAAAPRFGQYDASDLEEVADYAPRGKRVMLPLSKFAFLPEKIQIGLDQASNQNARGKRVMLPLSKFAFLPEKIQIGLDQSSNRNARGKRVMLPLSKFAFLPEKIQIDVAKSGGVAQRRSSKRDPTYSDDSDRLQDIVRQLKDSPWSQWLGHNEAAGGF